MTKGFIDLGVSGNELACCGGCDRDYPDCPDGKWFRCIECGIDRCFDCLDNHRFTHATIPIRMVTK